MIPNVVRRIARRRLPHDLAAVEIDRGHHPVRRFVNWQSLNGEAYVGCGGIAATARALSRRLEIRRRERFSRAVCRTAIARSKNLAERSAGQARHVANIRESLRGLDERSC